jgi:hypothetical protein
MSDTQKVPGKSDSGQPSTFAVNGSDLRNFEVPPDALTPLSPTSNQKLKRPSVVEDFDLNAFRTDSDIEEPIEGETEVDTVRVEKPNRMEYVYIHPEWHDTLHIIPPSDKRKTCLVTPAVAKRHAEFCRKAFVVPYGSKAGNFYLWAILLEDKSGRVSDYAESALGRIEQGRGQWCRFEADLDNRSYRLYRAIEQKEPPQWPAQGLDFLVLKAFEGRMIADDNHEIIRQLVGVRL